MNRLDFPSKGAALLLVCMFLFNDLYATVLAIRSFDQLNFNYSKSEGLQASALNKQNAVHSGGNFGDSKEEPSALLQNRKKDRSEGEPHGAGDVLIPVDKADVHKISLESPDIARVGLDANMPLNDAQDDVLRFEIPKEVWAEGWQAAYIEYQAKGIANPTAIAKSINSEPVFGEGEVKESNQWQEVREEIFIDHLQSGFNYLRFSMVKPRFGFDIKNLKVWLTKEESRRELNFLERWEVNDHSYFTSIPVFTNARAYRLRHEEVPAMPNGVINITGGALAYQPSKEVAEKASAIGFKIAKEKILPGQNMRSAVIFYFDYQARRWSSLEIDSIEPTHGIAFVPNMGNTQYFAGMIQSPEMPEASAFAPTTIQDIEAANPAAGMNIMQPPSVSQTGEASINYPLEIPAGRKGVQPQLALTYNSDGGTGWLGVGWNISIPSIAVDTRWGVPRFNPTEQTESYTLNGEALF